jgi:hypothetical protein
MTSNGVNLLLLGLRGSGKTSYLAALWHLVEAGELPASFTSVQLQPDREYLNRIRDNWLRFEEVGRTPLGGQETLSLLLRDTATGALVDLNVPDLSGESFRLQWTLRKATRHYVDFANQSSAALLFVHPEELRRSKLIPPKYAPAEGSEIQMPESSSDAGSQAKAWSPELTPTQVQLVEILQFAAMLRSPQKNGRIAVIVSAWDLVKAPMLPSAWLESNAPLLYQYLVTNESRTPFKIYGVSALGGDLQKDLQNLQTQTIPTRRIRVVDQALEHHHDLTAPLRFLLPSI